MGVETPETCVSSSKSPSCLRFYRSNKIRFKSFTEIENGPTSVSPVICSPDIIAPSRVRPSVNVTLTSSSLSHPSPSPAQSTSAVQPEPRKHQILPLHSAPPALAPWPSPPPAYPSIQQTRVDTSRPEAPSRQSGPPRSRSETPEASSRSFAFYLVLPKQHLRSANPRKGPTHSIKTASSPLSQKTQTKDAAQPAPALQETPP
jgi:hypothetical protein